MITGIFLENFKAHSNLKLDDLPSIVVFVGRNNTGKSSILHAAALPKHGPVLAPLSPSGTPGKSYTVERRRRGSR